MVEACLVCARPQVPFLTVHQNKKQMCKPTEKLRLQAVGRMDFCLGNERLYLPALEAGLLQGMESGEDRGKCVCHGVGLQVLRWLRGECSPISVSAPGEGEERLETVAGWWAREMPLSPCLSAVVE